MLPREGFVGRRWDPRKHEDYRLPLSNGQTFSSCEAGLLVVDIYPENTRDSSYASAERATRILDDITARCIERASSGFVAVKPSTRRFNRTARPHLSFIEERLGSVLGYFKPTEQTEQQLAIRRDNASYEEWLIGGSRTQLEGHSNMPWELESLLSCPDQLECASVLFGETREVLLFARLWDGLDGLITALTSADAGQQR